MVSFNSAIAAVPEEQNSTSVVTAERALQQQIDFTKQHQPLIDEVLMLGEKLNSLMQAYMKSIVIKHSYITQPKQTRELSFEINRKKQLAIQLVKEIDTTEKEIKSIKTRLEGILSALPILPRTFNQPPIDGSQVNRKTRRKVGKECHFHVTTQTQYDQNCAVKGMRDKVLLTVSLLNENLVKHADMLRRANDAEKESYYCLLVNTDASSSALADAARELYNKTPKTEEAERAKWKDKCRRHLRDAYPKLVVDPAAEAKKAFEHQKKTDIVAYYEAEQTARKTLEEQEDQTYLRVLSKAMQTALATNDKFADAVAMTTPVMAEAVEHEIYDLSNYESTLDKGTLKVLQSKITEAFSLLRFGETPEKYRAGTFLAHIDATKYDVHHCALSKKMRIYYAIIPATGDKPSQYVVLSISNHDTKFEDRQFKLDKTKIVNFSEE